jgi:hypothetical protein
VRFLYNNLLDDADLSNDGTPPGFGLDNLKDTRLSRTYRAIATSDNIVIDLGSAQEVDTFAMAGHNIEALEVTLEANSSDSWTSPPFSRTVTLTARMGYDYFTAETYRYWRVVIDDPGNSLGAIEVGRIGIGVGFDGPAMDPDITLPRETTTNRALSRTRQSYVNEGIRYRAARVTFPFITTAQKASFDEMFEIADVQPVFIDLPELSDEEAMYANLSESFDYSYRFGTDRFSMALTFEEVF